MKKLVLVVFASMVLFACTKPQQDEYASFRGKSSATIFHAGEKALAKEDYELAVKNFEALDAIYPFGPYAQQAQLDIIYAYYKNGDDTSAIAAADRYIRLYPRSRHVDYAYYMRGIVGFSVGLSWLQKVVATDPAPRDISKLKQSFSSFAMVTHERPNSIYAPDSLVRMAYIRNLLARREVEIAEFYMARDAYVAAANRATYVFQHFQGSPEVAKALAIMVESYRALGLEKLATDSYRILQANYADTPEYKKLVDA